MLTATNPDMLVVLGAAAVRHRLIMALHNSIFTLLTTTAYYARRCCCALRPSSSLYSLYSLYAPYYALRLLPMCRRCCCARRPSWSVPRAWCARRRRPPPQGVTLPDSCFRSSLLALLPAACAALSLFSSFASTVASRLLPPLLGISEALPSVSEPFGIVKLQHIERQPDFDLAHPGAS